MHAFNYAKQEWIHGSEAKQELISQLTDELQVLKSDNGQNYLRFIASPLSVEEAIAKTEIALAELTSACGCNQ